MRFSKNLAVLSALLVAVNALPQGDQNTYVPCIPIPGQDGMGCSNTDYSCNLTTKLCMPKLETTTASSDENPAVTSSSSPDSDDNDNMGTPMVGPSESSSAKSGFSNGLKIAIACGVVGGVLCVAGAMFVYRYRQSDTRSLKGVSPAMSEKSARKFSLPFTRSSRDGSEDEGELIGDDRKQKSWAEYGHYPQPVSLASPPPAARRGQRNQRGDSTETYETEEYAVDVDSNEEFEELEPPQPTFTRPARYSSGSASTGVSEKGSVHIVYRVANPDQAEQAQQSLFKAAKKLHRRDSKKWALAPENGYSSKSSKRSSRTSRTSNSRENVATEALYIGIEGYSNETDAYSLEQGDPTSPTGGRYKMASVYSEYSAESSVLSEIPELPQRSGASPLAKPEEANSNVQNPSSSSKRSSLYELHAPIFQTLERSSVMPPVPDVPNMYKQ